MKSKSNLSTRSFWKFKAKNWQQVFRKIAALDSNPAGAKFEEFSEALFHTKIMREEGYKNYWRPKKNAFKGPPIRKDECCSLIF